MKIKYFTLPLMILVFVPLFIFSGLSLFSKKGTDHEAGLLDSHSISERLQIQTGAAVAAKTDTITIIKTQWQPRKKRKYRAIVIANTDAKLGTVKLHAQVYSGSLVIKAGQMEYHKPEKHYRKIFTFVRTPPDRILVQSSGGGSATAPISRDTYEGK